MIVVIIFIIDIIIITCITAINFVINFHFCYIYLLKLYLR